MARKVKTSEKQNPKSKKLSEIEETKRILKNWLETITNTVLEANKTIRTTRMGIHYSYSMSDFMTKALVGNSCDVEFTLYDRNKEPMIDRISEIVFMHPYPIDPIFSIPLQSKHSSEIIEQVSLLFQNKFNTKNIDKEIDLTLKLEPQIALNETVQSYGWKDIDDFVDNRIFPKFLTYSTLQKPILTKDNFYNEAVCILKNIHNSSDEVNGIKELNEYEEREIFYLLDAIANKDKNYINRIMKEWDLEELQVTPEKVIYDMSFPNDEPFEKPIPLKVSDIEIELRKNRCAMVKRTIQKLCDRMKIPRNTSKTGRPKNMNTVIKK